MAAWRHEISLLVFKIYSVYISALEEIFRNSDPHIGPFFVRDNFCQSTSGKERISKLKSTGPMHMFVIN